MRPGELILEATAPHLGTTERAPTALAPFDLLVAWLITLGVLGVGLVALQRFDSRLVLVLGSGITVAAVAASRLPITWRDGRVGGTLLAILFLALLVRVPPYPHPNGGQDQGLYVSLSHVFAKFGGYVFDDPLAAELSPQQAELYAAGGGFLLPGVKASSSGHDFVIHFYPLHPIFMSLAAAGLGAEWRLVSLTFFALLGLASLSFLAWELTGSRYVALVVAGLVAAHPGLAFFAKLPVAETVALAFSATAAYYLARFVRLAQHGSVEAAWLVLSAGCFLCSCFARPTGLILLPAVFVIVAALVVSDLPPSARKLIVGFWLCALTAVALSYAFLFHAWGEALDQLPIGRSLIYAFGGRTEVEAVAVIAAAVVLLALLGRGRARRERLRSGLERWHVSVAVALWGLSLLFVAWQSWLRLPEHEKLVREVLTIRPGLEGALRLLPYRMVLYLSPLGAVLVGLAPFVWRRAFRGRRSVLLVLVATLLIAYSGYSAYSLYSYYYDRYLHSDLVPYALVVLGIALGELRNRRPRLGNAAAVLIVGSLAVFTLFQVGKREGADPELFEELRASHDEDGLYFIELATVSRAQAIATALRFDLDLLVFPIANQFELARAPVAELLGRPHTGYVLSGEPEPAHSFLTLERVLDYRESFLHDGSGHLLERIHQLQHRGSLTTSGLHAPWTRALLPLRYSHIHQPLFLYRIDAAALAAGNYRTAIRFESEELLSGWTDSRLRVEDPRRASAGAARLGRPEIMGWPHQHQALVHGPYHYLPAGAYRAEFRLRLSGGGGDAVVAGIDVAAPNGTRVLASRCLLARDFPLPDRYETIPLPFESAEDLQGLEYRVWYRGLGTLWSDFVELVSVPGGPLPGTPIGVGPPGGDLCGPAD